MIPLKKPWNTYPSSDFQINRASPQAQGLRHFWPCVNAGAHNIRDYGQIPDHLSDSSGPTTVQTGAGVNAQVRNWDADSEWLEVASGDDYATVTDGVNSKSHTLTFWVRGTFSGARRYICSDWNAAGSDWAMYLRAESGGSWTGFLQTNGANRQLAWEAGTYAINTNYFHALVVDYEINANGQARWYINGTNISDNPSLVGYAIDTNSSPLAFGNVGVNDGTAAWRGDIWDIRIYDRVLTTEQLHDIQYRPYDVFMPQTIWMPTAAAAPAGGPNFMTLLGVG